MDSIENVRKITIVELVNNSPTSIRLKNCINLADETNGLPFETIGDYLDAGFTADETLLELKNIGRKTAEELINLIYPLIKELPKQPDTEKNVDAEIERISDDESQIRNTAIVDLVNKYGISARLKNCINVANGKNQLPFKTIGDYLNEGSTARSRLREINGLGRQTVGELIHLIETIRRPVLSDEPENKK